MGVARGAVLGKASEWVGMLERTGNNDIWFSDDWGITGQSWCFAFTQSCFWYAPVSADGKLPHQSMYCPYGIAWARENNQAVEVDGGGPIPGDIVFFSWDMATWPRWRAGTGDHVAIVEGWDGGDLIWTIEGNVGDPQGVWRKVRSISETVVCFWRPTVFDADGPPPPPPSGAPDGHNIRYMQQFLADHGMDPGPVDGELGPQTAAGVTRWQQFLQAHGYDPGPIDGEWGPRTTAATGAWLNAQQQPPAEEDMTPDQSAQLERVYHILNDGDRWSYWTDCVTQARSAMGSVTFVQDPRNGAVLLVWGTTWKRWIRSPEILNGYMAYWGARGANTTLQLWDPIHIDNLIDVEDLTGAAHAARDLAQASKDDIAKILALAKGELPPPPPPEKILDVEASLAQANKDQLIAALIAVLTKQGGSLTDIPQLPMDAPPAQ